MRVLRDHRRDHRLGQGQRESRARARAARSDSQLGFDLYAAGNTLFVVAPQPYLTRVLFAVAEADGLREVPELAQGLDLGEHVQTIERLVGTWPGTLWLQTLDF